MLTQVAHQRQRAGAYGGDGWLPAFVYPHRDVGGFHGPVYDCGQVILD